jgi:uncharacterized phiE125 gp8 family phage protein
MIDFNDISESFTEPITVEQVKSHLRLEGNENDAMLEGFIRPAREKCEQVTGRALVAHTFEIYEDENEGEIELLYPPIDEVESVEYWDGEDWVELDSGSFVVGGVKQKVVLISKSYKVVRVTYVVTPDPNQDLLRLIKDLIQVWFDNRPDIDDLQQKVINRMAKYKVWQAA